MIAKILVAAMIIALLCSLTVSRESSAHTGYYRNTGNGLNLREGPSGDYAVIGYVPSRAVVKAFGHKGNWLKLRLVESGAVGWAWLWNFDPSSYTPPPPAPSPPPSVTTGTGYCMTNYWHEWVCASPNVADAIRYWANQYGVGTWWMFALAACESSF